MNKQPVSYLQKDPRWKDKPYRVPGESSTIGSAGCGPTCAAMVIETLTGKTFTPEDACNWSVEHGYKALKQGTYYSYFKPQLAAFGIECDMLSWTSTYGRPNHENHKRALELLQDGYYLIALMNKGNWTSSGHFVLVWWADNKICINDPNSTRQDRVSGDPYTFRSEVKYYWWVDARAYNRPQKPEIEEEIMTGSEILSALTDEQAYELLVKAQRHAAAKPEPAWSQAEGHWQRATEAGVINGGSPEGLLKRDELVAVLGRKGLV